MNEQPPKHWLDLALIASRGDKELAAEIARRLWARHGVPGARAYIHEGQLVVSHPGGIVGLESGWERFP